MSLKNVTDRDFRENVQASGVTVADFWAPWCPPCKPLLPIMDELDAEYGSNVAFLKVNIDDSPATTTEFGIMSAPTVIVFKDGQPVEKLVGLRPKQAYAGAIAKHSS